VKGSAVSWIFALGFVAACGRSSPPSTAAVTSTVPPSTEPSPIPVEATETSLPTTQSPTDAPQPTPVGLLRLTNDPRLDSYPAWSGDSHRIAWSSDRSGIYEIYAMSADGSNLIQLTEDEGTVLKDDPTWSPDGSQIAFASHSDTTRIYAFDVERAAEQPFNPFEPSSQGFPEPLSNYYVDAFSPSWSPDGRRVALIAHDSNVVRQVFTLDLVSGESVQLTHGSSPAYRPSWSPDGRWIAYTSRVEGNREIYLIAADGSGLTQLTDDPAADDSPSWSPDGQFIVFHSNRTGDSDLYVMRFDGSNVLRLDIGGGENSSPSWSPDGRFIAFVSDRDGNDEIYRMDAPALQP